MKKILALLMMVTFVTGGEVMAFSPTYSNPSDSTLDFYPMMRRQMEREVTLDFENNPEQYKQKRAIKDAEAEYRAGNKNFDPKYGSKTGIFKFQKSNKKQEFSTDANGNIIIKDSEK